MNGAFSGVYPLLESQKRCLRSRTSPFRPDTSRKNRELRILYPYFTISSTLPEWLANSGAYMHSMWAMPFWYVPRWDTLSGYSKT